MSKHTSEVCNPAMKIIKTTSYSLIELIIFHSELNTKKDIPTLTMKAKEIFLSGNQEWLSNITPHPCTRKLDLSLIKKIFKASSSNAQMVLQTNVGKTQKKPTLNP